VLSDTELAHSRRVNEQDFVPPPRQFGMYVPGFAARFDGDPRGQTLWTKQFFQAA
jgi:hypothetical protein